MQGLYALDGSYRVRLTDDGPMEISTTGTHGLYAPDGSYRVTLVGTEGGAALVTDQMELTLSGTTYTFTVEDGVITDIQSA